MSKLQCRYESSELRDSNLTNRKTDQWLAGHEGFSHVSIKSRCNVVNLPNTSKFPACILLDIKPIPVFLGFQKCKGVAATYTYPTLSVASSKYLFRSLNSIHCWSTRAPSKMEFDTDKFLDSLLHENDPVIRPCFSDKRQEAAEKFNDLLSQHLPPSVLSWACDEEGWSFEYNNANVVVVNDELNDLNTYASSDTMPRTFLDGMRKQLRWMSQDIGELDLTPTGFAVKLIEICEEADNWIRMWQDELQARSSKQYCSKLNRESGLKPVDGWDARRVESWESILDNPAGLNLATIQDTAQHLLGSTISETCSKIPDYLRILHVEPVFRDNLVQRFLKMQARMHHRLLNMTYAELRQSVSPKVIPRGSREDNIEGLAGELARQHVTFHGAPHRVIQSIVRYGFVVPGEEIGDTGKELSIRCGSTFGEGIYSSPDPLFASSYLQYDRISHCTITQPANVPGMRLLVCATLMGRPMIRTRAQRNADTADLLGDHAHSHVSTDQLEYVVFDSAQIIPVYVLHLDYGAEMARKEFDRIAQDPQQYFWRRREAMKFDRVEVQEPTCPGDVQWKKQALKAAAAKWFPYGYGPAQGTSFVIEDIADVSDDEEEYGDLQELRIEQDDEMRERKVEKGSSWFDEFQTVRKTSLSVKVKYS